VLLIYKTDNETSFYKPKVEKQSFRIDIKGQKDQVGKGEKNDRSYAQ
jgi:hypothetical protein